MRTLHDKQYLKWVTGLKLLVFSSLFMLLLAGFTNIGATVYPLTDEFKITTVFLVRHAEKSTTPANDPTLLETGQKRAEELAYILGKSGIKAIYTSQFLRTKQTAEPLAKQLGLTSQTIPIKLNANSEISPESIKEIVEQIYKNAGDNALIVGHSNTVPDVIKALGGDIVPTIDEKEFDNLFVVTVYGRGKAKVTNLKYGQQK